jgi:hypothetical protein
MAGKDKHMLLEEIGRLLAYGEKAPEIDPALLEYLDTDTMEKMLENLKRKTSGLKEEDREWLQQFRKEK